MLLLIIILALLFAGGGGYYGYSRWGAGGGLGMSAPSSSSSWSYIYSARFANIRIPQQRDVASQIPAGAVPENHFPGTVPHSQSR